MDHAVAKSVCMLVYLAYGKICRLVPLIGSDLGIRILIWNGTCVIFSHADRLDDEPDNNFPVFQIIGLQPYLSGWHRPPHLNHRPDVDIKKKHAEQSAAGYVQPEKGRRDKCLQPHGGNIDENTHKWQYHQPGAGSDTQVQKDGDGAGKFSLTGKVRSGVISIGIKEDVYRLRIAFFALKGYHNFVLTFMFSI